MSPAVALWAKLGKNVWPTAYHPLVCHLIDTAAVAKQIWENVLRDPVKQRFAAVIGTKDIEQCGRWVAFWVGAHDIGKACPGFQVRADDHRMLALSALLTDSGFDLPAAKPVPHATVSVPVLLEFLQGVGYADRLARRLAVCIGGHHGFFPTPNECTGYGLLPAVLGNDRWTLARADLLATLAALLEIPAGAAPAGGVAADQSYLMLLAGLTTAADWVSSNLNFFPLCGNTATPTLDAAAAVLFVRNYFAHAKQRAEFALAAIGWLGRANADGRVRSFAELFPNILSPRPLQVAAEAVARAMDGPALVLIESPMGEGKTEAAQVIADACDRRGGQGCYFALPTMATSNGMFGRVQEFLRRQKAAGERVNLHLLHGQSLLSPAYAELQKAAGGEPIVANVAEDYADDGAVVADAWFAEDKRQALLAPYGVGTIDQSLLSVLQTKFGFLRLFGLAGKCVVLDEVHAYDAYTGTLMEHLLKWLAALGCPVVLLSATLPAARRAKLLAAYAGGPVAVNGATYPCLAVVKPGDTSVTPQPLDVSDTSRKTIQLEKVPFDDLPRRLGTALTEGGCVAVIRNTVADAQATYRTLRDALQPQGVCVKLFHARFLMRHRQEIERNVLDWFGRERKQWPGGATKMVLVATQVVEQSLDLDFDLLVTDVAPVDLVLQRCGRLQRHRRVGRVLNPDQPTVWLIEPEPGDGPPSFGINELIYARFVLLRSWLALRGRTAIALPGDVEGLVESVYADPADVTHSDLAWAAALKESHKTFKGDYKEDERAAGTFVIGEPADEDDILGRYNQGLEEDNPEIAKCRQAFTRLAEPTVALVVVYEVGGKQWLDAEATLPAPLHRRPTVEDVKALLGNAVTVSHKACVFHYLREKPPTKWAKHGLLRFYRLVMVDATGLASGSFALTVSDSEGVLWPGSK